MTLCGLGWYCWDSYFVSFSWDVVVFNPSRDIFRFRALCTTAAVFEHFNYTDLPMYSSNCEAAAADHQQQTFRILSFGDRISFRLVGPRSRSTPRTDFRLSSSRRHQLYSAFTN